MTFNKVLLNSQPMGHTNLRLETTCIEIQVEFIFQTLN